MLTTLNYLTWIQASKSQHEPKDHARHRQKQLRNVANEPAAAAWNPLLTLLSGLEFCRVNKINPW